ncbi:MAG TPA: sodium/glutamate symporter [Selenomonadales bacterium]|nr:sodium/glutamate symporter [Selenomonadales bacterium]
MAFTPWTVFSDFAIIATLLLVGQLLRAKLKLIQGLYLPAALIGGFIGLTLGPNGYGLLPLSNNMGTYAAILIVLVFAAMPLGQEATSFSKVGERVGSMWTYGELTFLAQHAVAMILGLFVLTPFFSTPVGFGFMLPAGWVGGPGTAIAIGTTFTSYGWEEAMTLGMISATTGILYGILGGVALIKYGAQKGYTNFISSFDNMPQELRSGLLAPQDFKSMGKETVSANVIDPLMFNLGLILLASGAGYLVTNKIAAWYPGLSLPVFAVAMICGTILQYVLRKTGGAKYVDGDITNRIGSTCTDILVTFGIASIKISLVVKYALPLTVLILVGGVLYCTFMVFFVGPRMIKENWFEKSMFSFGWATGVMATSMILLRIVDPKFKSKTLEDFAIAYIPMSVVEMLVVTFVPIAIMQGFAYHWTALAVAGCLVVLFIAWRMKWIYRHGAKRYAEGVDKPAE